MNIHMSYITYKVVSCGVLCLTALICGANSEARSKAGPRIFPAPRYIRRELYGPRRGPLIPLGLNARGQVAGKYVNAVGQTRAFVWEHGVLTDLGTLGGSNSAAFALNDHGQVVGEADTKEGTKHAFLWQSGRMRDLGALPQYPYSVARSVNLKGQVVGLLFQQPTHMPEAAFLWESGRGLKKLPGKLDWDAMVAVNQQGQVLTARGVFDLNTGRAIPPGRLGGDYTRATAFNDRRQVVGVAGTGRLIGGSATSSPRPQYVAFLVNNGKMKEVTLFDDEDQAATLVINNRGQIADTNRLLFAPNRVVPIKAFLPKDWGAVQVTALNDRGQITGFTIDGKHGFLLTPDPKQPFDRLVLPNDALNRRLLVAVQAGTLAEIRSLVRAGAELNPQIRDQRLPAPPPAPLSAAIAANRVDAAQTLLELGAKPDIKQTAFTSLTQAAMAGADSLVRLLVLHGANVNTSDTLGYSPLFAAALKCRPETVRLLLERGANPSLYSAELGPPILAGVASGRLETVQLLFGKGGTESQDHYGRTALMIAAASPSSEITTWLLQQGADPNFTNAAGDTALMSAANPEVARVLLEYGAKINAQNANGRTALLSAIRGFHPDVARLLLERGADPNLYDTGGDTPLIAVGQGGYDESWRDLPRLLLEKGADPNAANTVGWTPLTHAGVHYQFRQEWTRLLLEHGANPNYPDLSFHETPLLRACTFSDVEIVRLMLQHGGDPNQKDSAGHNALYYVMRNGHAEVRAKLVALLKAAGATE